MHDIDRALFEGQEEGGTWGEVSGEQSRLGQDRATYESQSDEFTSYEDSGNPGELWGEAGANDSGELALAAELLAVSNDRELDQFLGNLVKSAVSAARSFAGSDAGQAVGNILKDSARRALPQLGQAVGNYVSPGMGGQAGQRVGQWLGTKFETGLQLEGLSAEDRDFETARAFVRFATSTAKRAASTPTSIPASTAAKQAATAAAKQHLPGLLRPPTTQGAGPSSGRWVRRNGAIVVLGAG
ncbi:hypothetical protein [Arthrobacter sp. L77]|uniref:hypothetical protein n=1 Tax=Arthrobacter sp. L77 TaxID=1496689 RepID=UPI0012E049D8|nr:hypothetical protein [Arthrobacter sp. L77]